MKDLKKRIVINPKILSGKPIIKGTRIPIYVILGSLAAGMDHKNIMKEYGIEFDDILACLSYATEVVTSEETYPLIKKER